MAHRRRREVAQRVVVGALALDAAEAEALRGQAPREAVRARAPGSAQLAVLVEVESEGLVGPVELEGGETERCEVHRLVDLDHGSRRLVHEVDREQQVLARRRQDRDVTSETGVDRGKLLERGGHRRDERRITPQLGDPLEPDVALLAQPVERPADSQHDSVLCRRLCESQVSVTRRHARDRSGLRESEDAAAP